MIELHKPYPEVGPDVFKEPIDMDSAILAGQDRITEYLDRIANYSERQRETKAPDVIDLSPASGSQAARTYTTKTGLRVLGIIISGQPLTEAYRLTVGSRPYNFFAPTTVFIPFPIEVTQGIDLAMANITTPNSTTWSCYVFGYPF